MRFIHFGFPFDLRYESDMYMAVIHFGFPFDLIGSYTLWLPFDLMCESGI